MKSSKLLTLCAMLLLLAPAFAQTGNGKAKIPFDFQIGNQTLSAGDYRVKTEGVKLQLSRIGGPDYAVVMTISVPGDRASNGSPRLVFNRYGDEHFLSEAWLGASDNGNRLFTSASEVRLGQSMQDTGVSVAKVQNTK